MKLRFLLFISFAFGQVSYNHPELDWQTIETDHFRIHFMLRRNSPQEKGQLWQSGFTHL